MEVLGLSFKNVARGPGWEAKPGSLLIFKIIFQQSSAVPQQLPRAFS
jgi:hypothetical protein